MSRTRRYWDALWTGFYWKPWTRGNDRKFHFKPPRWFKVMRARIRRAKDVDALRNGREPERWRRSDVWEWN